MLEIENVSVTFSEKPVFSNLSLKVSQKERLSVIGRNGSGKSTLALALTGVIPDFVPAKLFGKLILPNSGIILQNPSSQFFAMSVSDELGEKGMDLAKKLGLGYLFDRNVFQLSEGEKQKINLLANLSFDHDLLFLDEPLELLDPKEVLRFRKLIEGVDDRAIVWFDKQDPNFVGAKKFFLGDSKLVEFPKVKKNIRGGCVLEADFNVELSNFSLSAALCLKEGEKVAFIGSNGSGKSTVLKALAGILPFNGTISSKLPITFAPQNPSHIFFKNTVKEELSVPENVSKLGLQDLVSLSPMHLSKGQQKLLSVASISSNAVAILDEPTTWLDSYNRALVYKFISESQQSMVIATHDPDLLSYCDKIFFVEGGVVSECSNIMVNRFFQG